MQKVERKLNNMHKIRIFMQKCRICKALAFFSDFYKDAWYTEDTIGKIPPVRLGAPKSIQPDFRIRKTRA